jgi:hypothetical protein
VLTQTSPLRLLWTPGRSNARKRTLLANLNTAGRWSTLFEGRVSSVTRTQSDHRKNHRRAGPLSSAGEPGGFHDRVDIRELRIKSDHPSENPNSFDLYYTALQNVEDALRRKVSPNILISARVGSAKLWIKDKPLARYALPKIFILARRATFGYEQR